jgi:hypothetical protein
MIWGTLLLNTKFLRVTWFIHGDLVYPWRPGLIDMLKMI